MYIPICSNPNCPNKAEVERLRERIHQLEREVQRVETLRRLRYGTTSSWFSSALDDDVTESLGS